MTPGSVAAQGVVALHLNASGNLASITPAIRGYTVGGTIPVHVATCSGCVGGTTGGTYTLTGTSFTLKPSGTGNGSFYAGRDFPSGIAITSGQYLLFVMTNGVLFGYTQPSSVVPYLYSNSGADCGNTLSSSGIY